LRAGCPERSRVVEMQRRADATGKMQWVLTFAYFATRNVR
jgi:hypothetical protein